MCKSLIPHPLPYYFHLSISISSCDSRLHLPYVFAFTPKELNSRLRHIMAFIKCQKYNVMLYLQVSRQDNCIEIIRIYSNMYIIWIIMSIIFSITFLWKSNFIAMVELQLSLDSWNIAVNGCIISIPPIIQSNTTIMQQNIDRIQCICLK